MPGCSHGFDEYTLCPLIDLDFSSFKRRSRLEPDVGREFRMRQARNIVTTNMEPLRAGWGEIVGPNYRVETAPRNSCSADAALAKRPTRIVPHSRVKTIAPFRDRAPIENDCGGRVGAELLFCRLRAFRGMAGASTGILKHRESSQLTQSGPGPNSMAIRCRQCDQVTMQHRIGGANLGQRAGSP